jgi:hypothetical protein
MLDHLSYSSVQLFLNNPAAWRDKYILGIRDQKTSPAALVGTAFHKYMELDWLNDEKARDTARSIIIDSLDVDWGETGSKEKALDELDNLIWHIKQENLRNKLSIKNYGVETLFDSKISGIKLPFISYVDFWYRDQQDALHLVDWKTLKTYNDNLIPSYKLQATIYYLQARLILGSRPKDFTFVEVKASKNKDGSPQVRYLVYDFEDKETKQEMKAIKYLIQQASKKMTSKREIYLPNIKDQYDKNAFDRFITNYLKTL